MIGDPESDAAHRAMLSVRPWRLALADHQKIRRYSPDLAEHGADRLAIHRMSVHLGVTLRGTEEILHSE